MMLARAGLAIAISCTLVAALEQAGSAPPVQVPVPLPVASAGTSFFDSIDSLQVAAYPANNLPADLVAELSKPFPTRWKRLGRRDWVPTPMPDDLAARLPKSTTLRCFTARPDISPATQGGRPRVLLGQREAGGKMAVSDKGVGPFLWWEDATKSLFAVAALAPEQIVIEYLADPVGELGSQERMLRAPAAASKPAVGDLVRRVTRNHVTRTAMLLPAGGQVALPVGKLEADELRVAVALDGDGWKKVRDRMERTPKRSDGAVVAVDAYVDGRRQRLWSRELGPDDSGAGFLEARASLKSVKGRAVELRLVTEPGAKGDASFDYVLWSDLTFADRSAKPDRPHVLLVDIDTLRADSLSLYGARNATTPNLDAWARRRATVYRDASSTASWTLPSTTSILNGTYVQQHGVTAMGATTIGSFPTLPVLLRQAGYETWGFADGGYLDPCFGFSEGFDGYSCAHRHEIDWAEALARLRDRRCGRPIFLFLHTYLVHSPYSVDTRFDAAHGPYQGELAGQPIDLDNVIDPFNRHALDLSPRERTYVRNLYDAGVARMDALLARFLVDVERALEGEEWMLVFTSDHGECFFEHDRMGHGSSLHSEVTHVPLMIVWPRSMKDAPAVGMDETPVSSVDIVPTILDVVGVTGPDGLPGRSLRSPDAEVGPRLACCGLEQQSITSGGWRLIRHVAGETATFELYDLTKDPREQQNLAAAEPERVRQMDAALTRMVDALPKAQPRGSQADIGPETLAGLRALGYVK